MEEGSAQDRLRRFIEGGGYGVGDRLPPERQLIAELGMTRTALRKGLEAMEREGAIWRHVGKGTFVAGVASEVAAMEDTGEAQPPAIPAPLMDLGRQITPLRMMRARLCIEPAIAREAAANASTEAITRVRLAMERANAATSWRDYEAQDDLFHRAIAEATDNPMLLAVFDQMNQVRRVVIWGNLERESARPAHDHSSFGEHTAVTNAIAERNPAAAYEEMRMHLRSVSRRLFDEE